MDFSSEFTRAVGLDTSGIMGRMGRRKCSTLMMKCSLGLNYRTVQVVAVLAFGKQCFTIHNIMFMSVNGDVRNGIL